MSDLRKSRWETRVIPAHKLTPQLIETWTQMVANNEGLSSPFFAPQYTQIVASVVPEVYVGLMARDGEVFAFLPFTRQRFGIGGRLRLCDYQGVIAASDAEVDIQALVKGCGLRAWDFDHLLCSQFCTRSFHKRISESPVIDVSQGYEAYLAERRLSGKTELIKRCGTKLRKLEREIGSVRLEAHVQEPAVLHQLLAWQSGKYEDRRGVLPEVTLILEKFLEKITVPCKGMLSILYAGDTVAAAHFGLRSDSTWHWWFPAYNPQLDKYSTGIILLLKMIELAPQIGIKVIDLGKGDQDYKKHLMTGVIPIAEGSVEVSPCLSLGRKLRRGTKDFIKARPALLNSLQALLLRFKRSSALR